MSAALRREHLGFGAVLLFYLMLSLVVFNQIEEDAFIYFRLLENLAQGYGMVFNRGGQPVEAGSSLLWLFLLLPLWKLPLDIAVAAKLLGLAMGGVALWLVYCLSRLQIRDPALRLFPPLLTAASTPFLMWSQRGLDTPLFVVLVLWLALCCSSAGAFRWWPVPAVLLLPARPDGFFFLLGLLPACVVHRDQWRAIGKSLLIVVVAAIMLLTARLWYFHDLVPSPFYIKAGRGLGSGLEQIHQYVRGSYLHVFAVPLLFAAWKRGFWTPARMALAGFVLITAAWCAIAGDYMPYVRHLVPAIPLSYVLLVGAVDGFVPQGASRCRVLALGYVAVVLLITLFFSQSPGYFTIGRENRVRTYLAAFAANPFSHVKESVAKIASPSVSGALDEALGRRETLGTNDQALVGEFLRRNYPASALVIYDQMGQTPFYAGAGMRFVDSFGLTDRTVGRAYFERRKRTHALLRGYDAVASSVVALAFGERRDDVTETKALDYLFGLGPDLILINAATVGFDPQGIPARLERDARLMRAYELRYTLAGIVRVYEKTNTPRKPTPNVPAGLQVLAH